MLYDLILSSHPYLDAFDVRHYPENFAAFSQAAGPLLTAMAPEDAELQAQTLLEALARRYDGLSRREQKTARFRDKEVLTLFLTPAALALGGTAEAFAGVLNRLWIARYPREPYGMGTYETILRGFDPTLFGVPLQFGKRR